MNNEDIKMEENKTMEPVEVSEMTEEANHKKEELYLCNGHACDNNDIIPDCYKIGGICYMTRDKEFEVADPLDTAGVMICKELDKIEKIASKHVSIPRDNVNIYNSMAKIKFLVNVLFKYFKK